MRTIPSQERETRELEPLPARPLQEPLLPESPEGKPSRRLPRLKFSLLWKLAVVALLVGAGVFFFRGETTVTPSGTVARVMRGTLPITVVEKGEVEALESQIIKSEVRGQTKILEIVDEGYQVTEEDVKNGKVLVQLDTSELIERKVQHEISYQSAKSAFTDAQTQYDIQVKQNESDITEAQLKVKFAQIDFEKYVGAELAKDILAKHAPPPERTPLTVLDIGEVIAEAQPGAEAEGSPRAAGVAAGLPSAEAPGEPPAAAPLAGTTDGGESAAPAPGNGDIEAQTPPQPALATSDDIAKLERETAAVAEAVREQGDALDLASIVSDPRLGGDAMQAKQEAEAAIKLAEEELRSNEKRLEGTQKLFEKEFVTPLELEEDQMRVNRNRIELESAERQLQLLLDYEFPKQIQKLLSDYREAQRNLLRVEKQAVAKLMQAYTRLKSAEAQFALESNRLKETLERIENCTIRAERPGLVVYASSGDGPWSNRGPIEKGASVNQNQEIITIPDMTQMAVEAKVHESQIKKIKVGQKARIRIVGATDETLTGTVSKVSILPDQQNRWMNPDVKVYAVKVSIDGVHPWLKPGGSAEVEILVAELHDVLYVPIQAVSDSMGERVCYVESGIRPERRVVETGQMNDKYIEIKAGLQEGERVLLRAPENIENQEKAKQEQEENGVEDQPKPESAPAPEPVETTPAAAPASAAGERSRAS